MAKKADIGDTEELVMSSQAFFLPRFNTLHTLAQQQLNDGNKTEAKESYTRMLMLYDDINKSSLPPSDKQKAYGKLMYVFTALSSEQSFEFAPQLVKLGKYLIPISLVILVLLIIFFLKPQFSLTGMSVSDTTNKLNSAPYWDGGEPKFTIKGQTEINLDSYFNDADRDRLVYDVGDAPNLAISVSGSRLTITPDPMLKGTRVISITAFDNDYAANIIAILEIEQ